MLTDEEANRVVGAALVSSDGQEVGEVQNVIAHAADNRAAWAAVKVDDHQVLVPLDQAREEGGRLHVRYESEQIEGAPEHEDEDQLSSDAAERLYEHYGIDDSVLRDHSGFVTEESDREQGSSRDPRGGGGAADAQQGHP